MPALKNPRHEAFAQAILFGLYNSDRETYSNGRAYQRAGYLAKDAGKSGGSAEAAASRLLKKVQPILYRVPEILTRGRLPDGGESDSTWRTQEARHVGSDTIAPGF